MTKEEQRLLDNLLAYVQVVKKQAAVAGHGTDHDTNLIEMGKAQAYQHIERILVKRGASGGIRGRYPTG